MKVPLCTPSITEEEIGTVQDVLKSGWLAHGQYNKEFENAFAKYIGVKHAISLNSCTSALHLAIQLSGINKEVLVPSFTFVASANAIVTAGAKPVFVDIEESTRNIDTNKLEDKITENTQAIMPIHYGGHPANMGEIMKIADKYGLIVIEDSAETLGAEYYGEKTGSFGIGCFSFFPTKNITTGEGGMLTTNDDDLALLVKAYSGHGILSSTFEREKQDKPWLRAASYPGYNFRMSNMHAAIGLKQMGRVDKFNRDRLNASNYLTDKLDEILEITTPKIKEGSTHVYQMYTILLNEGVDRTKFLKFLNSEGIGASVHFDPPVHMQPYYKKGDFDKSNLEVTEDVARRIVTLPMFPSIFPEQLIYVVEKVKEGVYKSKNRNVLK